jgi:hypothetical protein
MRYFIIYTVHKILSIRLAVSQSRPISRMWEMKNISRTESETQYGICHLVSLGVERTKIKIVSGGVPWVSDQWALPGRR